MPEPDSLSSTSTSTKCCLQATGGGLGWVGLAAWCRSRPSGVSVLPCPTTRLNNLTVRFQGRAGYRQPPDPTEALVGGRYRRPVCRRARGQGLGWAVGCGASGARRPGCPQRMPGHTDLPRLAHMPWAPGLRVFGLTSPPFPVCVSRGGAFPGGGGGVPGGGSSGFLSGRQAGGTHTAGTTRGMPLISLLSSVHAVGGRSPRKGQVCGTPGLT